jgi:hypothetical protein
MKEHVCGEFAIERRGSEIGRGSAAPVQNKCDRPVLAAMKPTVESRIPTRSRTDIEQGVASELREVVVGQPKARYFF